MIDKEILVKAIVRVKWRYQGDSYLNDLVELAELYLADKLCEPMSVDEIEKIIYDVLKKTSISNGSVVSMSAMITASSRLMWLFLRKIVIGVPLINTA